MTNAAPIPDGSVIVTPAGTAPPDELTMTIGAREIYDKIVHVETKLDALPIADHETRIRALERWRYAAGGSLAMSAGAVVGVLAQLRGGR
ncbi:MAG TPA: hypothetical protein VFL65_00890 [Jatrophihabitans sp.]|nr:hypothetical protein [Jatrophihabitans sp.]